MRSRDGEEEEDLTVPLLQLELLLVRPLLLEEADVDGHAADVVLAEGLVKQLQVQDLRLAFVQVKVKLFQPLGIRGTGNGTRFVFLRAQPAKKGDARGII